MKSSLLGPLLCSITLLTGCAGMNSDFEFDKPAKDSGIWMSQADDMTLGNTHPSAGSVGKNVALAGYRLIDTGNVRLDVQLLVSGTRNVQRGITPISYPLRTSAPISGGVFSATTVAQPVSAVSQSIGSVSCNTPRCYPEPAAAFRKPDGIQRIWIAPYVSPDDAVHMGEIVFTVAKPSEWNGVL